MIKDFFLFYEAVLISILNIPLLPRNRKQFPKLSHLPPDLALLLTLSGSNYPNLEQSKVPIKEVRVIEVKLTLNILRTKYDMCTHFIISVESYKGGQGSLLVTVSLAYNPNWHLNLHRIINDPKGILSDR